MSKVRNLEELGVNFQKIAQRLLANQKLLRYLMYTDTDPLNANKPDIQSKDAYADGINGAVRVVPVISKKEDSTSIITLRIVEGEVESENDEYINIYFAIEVFVPLTQWVMLSSNLRPFAIMGEIQKSLSGKTVNGLGKMISSGFTTNFYSEEMSAYLMKFKIVQYH